MEPDDLEELEALVLATEEDRCQSERATKAGPKIKQLLQEFAELESFKASMVKLKELHATEDGMEMHIEQDPAISQRIAQAFASMVMESENYTEMQFYSFHTDERVTVLVQKIKGKTPHELRRIAEVDRDKILDRALKAELKLEGTLMILKECDAYLTQSDQNFIGSGSELHSHMQFHINRTL